MCDLLPENLQIIKTEQPSSPEKANIKERLNLHVKRRLQNDAPIQQTSVIKTTNDEGHEFTPGITLPVENAKKKTKDSPKTRRPYQKRSEKLKTDITQSSSNKKANTIITARSISADLEAQDDAQDMDNLDADGKSVTLLREKDKCPDILGMVLSMKKSALMNDAEVREFLEKIMNVIKS